MSFENSVNLSAKTALLVEIERYLRETGTAPTTFGRLCLNDPNFYKQMVVMGRCPTLRTQIKIAKFIGGYYKGKRKQWKSLEQ